MGFHPFQGRAPFGQYVEGLIGIQKFLMFPSLSGKSSIRTQWTSWSWSRDNRLSFHPFQGRAPFGLRRLGNLSACVKRRFHPFQGRAPFGLVQYSTYFHAPFSFHPFQGRAPFGLTEVISATQGKYMFPSLSGKSSIRTVACSHSMIW